MPEKTTLKINVSSDAHSHLIGRNGKQHKELQRDTKTRIHFPDLNLQPSKFTFVNGQFCDKLIDNINMVTKSNDVLISADVDNPMEHVGVAENARKLIRQHEQFVLHLCIPDTLNMTDYYVFLRYFDQVSQQWTNKQVFVSTAKDLSRIWTVRGTTGCADQVINIVNFITKKFESELKLPIQKMYSSIEIEEQYQKDVCYFGTKDIFKELNIQPVGNRDSLVKLFLRESGVELKFHDHNSTIFLIGNNPTNIFLARTRLITYLPATLTFEAPSESLSLMLTREKVEHLETVWNVRITKAIQSRRMNYIQLSVETVEKNLHIVYQMYSTMLAAFVQPMPPQQQLVYGNFNLTAAAAQLLGHNFLMMQDPLFRFSTFYPSLDLQPYGLLPPQVTTPTEIFTQPLLSPSILPSEPKEATSADELIANLPQSATNPEDSVMEASAKFIPVSVLEKSNGSSLDPSVVHEDQQLSASWASSINSFSDASQMSSPTKEISYMDIFNITPLVDY